jgi:hypothetical protein
VLGPVFQSRFGLTIAVRTPNVNKFLAEGGGFEPPTLAGTPLSKRAPRPSGHLPGEWHRRSVLPRVDALQRRVPLLNGRRNKWSARWDSNPQTPRSERGAFAEFDHGPWKPNAEWYRRVESNHRDPEGQTPYRRLSPPTSLRRRGARDRCRTCPGQRLGLLPLPAWATRAKPKLGRAGVEPALTPSFEDGASTERGLTAPTNEWRKVRDSNPQRRSVTVFETARPAYSPTFRANVSLAC